MLKGINKQIIEIKCTNDEFFEKALLFVRADKSDLPQSIFTEHSEVIFGKKYMKATKKRGKVTGALAAMLIAAAGLLGACIYFYAMMR